MRAVPADSGTIRANLQDMADWSDNGYMPVLVGTL